MTINRALNQVEMQCDAIGCSETSADVYNSDDFYVMIEDAKSAGWFMRRVGNDWEHYCPTCVRKGKHK